MSIEIGVCIGVSIACIILSGIALTMACICWSKVIGMEKSTHQVQFVPLENEKGNPIEGDALDKNMTEAFGSERLEQDYI